MHFSIGVQGIFLQENFEYQYVFPAFWTGHEYQNLIYQNPQLSERFCPVPTSLDNRGWTVLLQGFQLQLLWMKALPSWFGKLFYLFMYQFFKDIVSVYTNAMTQRSIMCGIDSHGQGVHFALGVLCEDTITITCFLSNLIVQRAGNIETSTQGHLFHRVVVAIWHGNTCMWLHRQPPMSPPIDGFNWLHPFSPSHNFISIW